MKDRALALKCEAVAKGHHLHVDVDDGDDDEEGDEDDGETPEEKAKRAMFEFRQKQLKDRLEKERRSGRFPRAPNDE